MSAKTILRSVAARARSLWVKEPVLVGTVLPVLVTVGVISQDQASVLSNSIASVGAVVVEIAAAFGVRSRVTPVGKKS